MLDVEVVPTESVLTFERNLLLRFTPPVAPVYGTKFATSPEVEAKDEEAYPNETNVDDAYGKLTKVDEAYAGRRYEVEAYANVGNEEEAFAMVS